MEVTPQDWHRKVAWSINDNIRTELQVRLERVDASAVRDAAAVDLAEFANDLEGWLQGLETMDPPVPDPTDPWTWSREGLTVTLLAMPRKQWGVPIVLNPEPSVAYHSTP